MKPRNFAKCLRTTVLAAAVVMSVQASADDIFLKLADIPGETTDAQHPNEVALLSYGFGVDADSSWTRGGGASVGKPNLGELRFAALMDKSVAGMFRKITDGKPTSTAELVVRTSLNGNRTGPEYVKYSFTGLFFTSVEQGLAGNGRASMTASAVYKSVRIQHFGPDGRATACVGFDVTTGLVEDC